MKKIILFTIIFLSDIPYTAKAQLNHDFQHRFGPDSAVYNEPHYFATKTKAARDKRPMKSFREQLWERMNTIKKKKMKKRCLRSSKMRQSLKQDPDLSDL